MFRVLGVDTILQRDDFIPAIDFSSPGEWRFNTTTLTHDLLHRVLGASPVRSDGPLRVYHLGGALPLVYGVTHPVVSTLPTFSDGYLGDVDAMASGKAEFDPPSRSADEFSASLTGALADTARLAGADSRSGRQRGARARRHSNSSAVRRASAGRRRLPSDRPASTRSLRSSSRCCSPQHPAAEPRDRFGTIFRRSPRMARGPSTAKSTSPPAVTSSPMVIPTRTSSSRS